MSNHQFKVGDTVRDRWEVSGKVGCKGVITSIVGDTIWVKFPQLFGDTYRKAGQLEKVNP